MFILGLFNKKPQQEQTLGEMNSDNGIREFMNMLQLIVNTVDTITARSSKDVEKWNFKDMDEVIELFNKIGRMSKGLGGK